MAEPENSEAQLPPAGPSGGLGQPQLPEALRQRVSHCNRESRPGDRPPAGAGEGSAGRLPEREPAAVPYPARRVSRRVRAPSRQVRPRTGRANVARECARARRGKPDPAGTRSGRHWPGASLWDMGPERCKTSPWRRLPLQNQIRPLAVWLPHSSEPPILPAGSPLLNLGAFSPTPTPSVRLAPT